jgi:signal transduction histidine kinase
VQQEVQATLATADGSLMEVAQGPLQRVARDGDALVLGREVRVAGLRYLQGFAVRLDRLGASVAAQVLDEAGLGEVLAVRFDGAEAPLPGYAYALRHTCAAPFADLVATLHLRSLTGAVPGARRTVWWLGGALVAATALGVWALAGMVASALRFARRRQDFVAAVSHELKTPLTAIRLHAEMLRDGLVGDPGKQNQYHGTIVAESERLSRLIGNVLELARLERDDRPVQPQIGDPMTVLAEVVRIVAPHAAAHGFAVTLAGEAPAPAARFDRDALLQVVMNLVDNALKFARGASDRRIELAYSAAPGGPAIAVRDHGPGVPSADLRRVFEPFWRGERELTRTTTGTGIGLALVRGLVERMGGRVSARNHPEGGFEVLVCLAPAG